MPTLQEELERLKKKRPELFTGGVPRPGAGVGASATGRTGVIEPRLGQEQPTDTGIPTGLSAVNDPQFRKGGARTSFLDKIGARYLKDDRPSEMTWQEKTGISIMDPKARRRFMFRDYLKKAEEAPSRSQALRFAKLAEIVGGEIESERKAGVDLATGLVSAEATRERTGVMEAADISEAEHRARLEGFRAEDLGLRRATLESTDLARRATAEYQTGMLRVAETTRPGSIESRVARLQLQREKDIADVIQKDKPPTGETDPKLRKWWKADAPNKAMKRIQAIDARYDKIIADLRTTGGVKAPKATKAPTYDEQVTRFKAKGQDMPFTREEYEVWLKTEEGKNWVSGSK